MASLQDLCVTTIEKTGADTHQILDDVKDQLPQRLFSLHPSLHLQFPTTLRNEQGGEIIIDTDIIVSYTGVYRVQITRTSDEGKPHTEEELNFIKNYINFLPKEEKTFDSLYGETSSDEIERIKHLREEWRKLGKSLDGPYTLENMIKDARPRLVHDFILSFVRQADVVRISLENSKGEEVLEFGDYDLPGNTNDYLVVMKTHQEANIPSFGDIVFLRKHMLGISNVIESALNFVGKVIFA